jgi:hypothetical protein
MLNSFQQLSLKNLQIPRVRDDSISGNMIAAFTQLLIANLNMRKDCY